MLNFTDPNYEVPSLPVTKSPYPIPAALFDLSTNPGNETYDFYDLMNSGLTEGWAIVR